MDVKMSNRLRLERTASVLLFVFDGRVRARAFRTGPDRNRGYVSNSRDRANHRWSHWWVRTGGIRNPERSRRHVAFPRVNGGRRSPRKR